MECDDLVSHRVNTGKQCVQLIHGRTSRLRRVLDGATYGSGSPRRRGAPAGHRVAAEERQVASKQHPIKTRQRPLQRVHVLGNE